MFRKITGTATSTVRFATAIPLGVARGVLERVTHHGSGDGSSSDSSQQQQDQGPPQREPQEQAAAATKAAAKAGAAEADAKQTAAPAAPKKSATPASTRKKAGTPKAGATEHDDAKPDVVLAVDAPPEEIEPPVDVVGQALAAEKAEEARRPSQPQPVHVDEEAEVVYSTTSEDD